MTSINNQIMYSVDQESNISSEYSSCQDIQEVKKSCSITSRRSSSNNNNKSSSKDIKEDLNEETRDNNSKNDDLEISYLIEKLSLIPDYFDKTLVNLKKQNVKKQNKIKNKNKKFKKNTPPLNITKEEQSSKDSILSTAQSNSNRVSNTSVQMKTIIQSNNNSPFIMNNNMNNNMTNINIPNIPQQTISNKTQIIIEALIINQSTEYQNKLLNEMASIDFYNFCLTDFGSNFIINKLQSFGPVYNKNSTSPEAKEAEVKRVIFSKFIFEKSKEYLMQFFFNQKCSEILVKIIKHLNFYERLIIWKSIYSNNFMYMATNTISSSIIINLINTLNDKSEEQFISKILGYYVPPQVKSVTNPMLYYTHVFNNNLVYLCNTNVYSATIVQTILGRFTSTSIEPFVCFILNNLSNLIINPFGRLVIEKYITVFKTQDQMKKDVFILSLQKIIEMVMFSEYGIQTIIHLIDEWGTKYMDSIFKSCFLNPTIYYCKNFMLDNGLNKLITMLLKSPKLVSSK